MNIDKIKESIKRHEDKYNFQDYVLNFIKEEELSKVKNIKDLEEFLREEVNKDYRFTNEDVIYYVKAMEFLTENDPSLTDSLQLAEDLGYPAKEINSELLASLLKSEINANNYEDFISEVINDLK